MAVMNPCCVPAKCQLTAHHIVAEVRFRNQKIWIDLNLEKKKVLILKSMFAISTKQSFKEQTVFTFTLDSRRLC